MRLLPAPLDPLGHHGVESAARDQQEAAPVDPAEIDAARRAPLDHLDQRLGIARDPELARQQIRRPQRHVRERGGRRIGETVDDLVHRAVAARDDDAVDLALEIARVPARLAAASGETPVDGVTAPFEQAHQALGAAPRLARAGDGVSDHEDVHEGAV